MIMMIFFWYAHTYSTIMTYTMRMVMVMAMAATYHHHGERYLLYLFNELEKLVYLQCNVLHNSLVLKAQYFELQC